MEKIKGFVAIGTSAEYETVLYSFKHLGDAINFVKAVTPLSDIGWDVFELNNLRSVSDAVSLFKQSTEKNHA